MKRLALLLGATTAVASVGLSLPAAQAGHDPCGGGIAGVAGPQVVDVAGLAYVDVRAIVEGTDDDDYLYSVWLYVESNGQAGLQRGGIDPIFNAADVCQESTNPDMLIF